MRVGVSAAAAAAAGRKPAGQRCRTGRKVAEGLVLVRRRRDGRTDGGEEIIGEQVSRRQRRTMSGDEEVYNIVMVSYVPACVDRDCEIIILLYRVGGGGITTD